MKLSIKKKYYSSVYVKLTSFLDRKKEALSRKEQFLVIIIDFY